MSVLGQVTSVSAFESVATLGMKQFGSQPGVEEPAAVSIVISS